MEIEIRIDGMSCGGCVAGVTRKLQAQPGVEDVQVSLQPGSARIRFDSAQINQAALESAIEEAGFDIVR
ncbi:MAG: heavy-metal-associated domain-containing protein [Formivibrio sp.]|nr:heavy-metal-associated domain-containing protein [Formivibrio sp.]